MLKILGNLWLKIVALVMGFLVWFHVATDKIYTVELRLPVTRIEVKEHHTLTTMPLDSILISVSAKGKQLLLSNWRQNGIRISATKLQVGHATFPLNSDNTFLVTPVKSAVIDDIVSPSAIELDVDVESKSMVAIRPDIVTVADDGFSVSKRIEVTPQKAALYGPKSVLRGITTVATEWREFDALRNNVTVKLPLIYPAGYGMRMEPDSATVTIEVIPIKTRVYEHLPIMVYNAPPSITTTTDPAFVRLELAGPPEDIDLLNKNAITVSADFRDADAAGVAPLKFDCPSNFRVKRASADSVRILTR